jgi:putative oxidoreductase
MSAVVILLGRILFSLIFIVAAPRHFSPEGIRHAAELGVPMAGLLVPLSGAMALLGGLSIALGYQAKPGAWMLVAFLLPVTFAMHAFWKLTDPVAIHTPAGDVRQEPRDAWRSAADFAVRIGAVQYRRMKSGAPLACVPARSADCTTVAL